MPSDSAFEESKGEKGLRPDVDSELLILRGLRRALVPSSSPEMRGGGEDLEGLRGVHEAEADKCLIKMILKSIEHERHDR